jgi:hypothetical protein
MDTENWQEKTEELLEKRVPLSPCSLQIPHGPHRFRTRASAMGFGRHTTLEINVHFKMYFIVSWRRLYTILDKNTLERIQLSSSKTQMCVEFLMPGLTFWWKFLLILREWSRINHTVIRGSLKISSTIPSVVRLYKYFVLSLEMCYSSEWYIALSYLKILFSLW